MSNMPLETAAHPEKLRRVVIEPLSRVEGHAAQLLGVGGGLQRERAHFVLLSVQS